MSIESNLKAAAYFERRAKLERNDEQERKRLLAVARKYRERAKGERERLADQALDAHPES